MTKNSISVAHLVQGFGKLIVQVECKIQQLRRDKRVRKGEFSNDDGKKLCYLMT